MNTYGYIIVNMQILTQQEHRDVLKAPCDCGRGCAKWPSCTPRCFVAGRRPSALALALGTSTGAAQQRVLRAQT